MRLHNLVFGLVALGLASCSFSPESDKSVAPQTSPTPPLSTPERATKADSQVNKTKAPPPFKLRSSISKAPAPAVIPKRSALFKWAKTREEALKRARKTGGYVLLVFQTSWSGQCVIMNREAFRDREIARTLSKAVVVPIDTDTKLGIQLAAEYKAEEIPTFVFLSPDGKMFGKLFGYMNVDWVQREIKRVFERAKIKG